MATPLTINDIHDAIDVLLTAYVKHKREQIGVKRRSEMWRLSDYPEGKVAEFIEMVNDPLGTVYRAGITRLGQCLYERIKEEYSVPGGIPEMRSSLYAIAERDAEQSGRRGAILDKLWDGVGSGSDIWYS